VIFGFNLKKCFDVIYLWDLNLRSVLCFELIVNDFEESVFLV
jgi:hypothetical protein